MHLLASLLAVASMTFGFASAMPTPSEITPITSFRLVAKVHPGPNVHDYDGQYISAYHIGAAVNDVTLFKSLEQAAPAYLNQSFLQWHLQSDHPWGTWLKPTEDAAVGRPMIKAWNVGTGGFSIGNGLLHQNSVAGWVVCKRSDGVPQVFALLHSNANGVSDCAHVDLAIQYS